MSGDFTQRGEAAILDKFLRGEVAVKCGADIVIELPLPYSIAPAEIFCAGAVKIADALGFVDYLSFGSESGDIQILSETAKFLQNETAEFKAVLNKNLKDKKSYPTALKDSLGFMIEQGLARFSDDGRALNILNGSNNILALEYLKQLSNIKSGIIPHTITRFGGAFNGGTTDGYATGGNLNNADATNAPAGNLINATATANTAAIAVAPTEAAAFGYSASAIREQLNKGGTEALKNAMPPEAYKIFEAGFSDGNTPDLKILSSLILYKLRSLSAANLKEIFDITEGLENRILSAATAVVDVAQLLSLTASKRYSGSRIGRIFLYALFNLTKKQMDVYKKATPYIKVLALKKERKDILTMLSGNKTVLTRYADYKNIADGAQKAMLKLNLTAADIYSLILKNPKYRGGGLDKKTGLRLV
jgi:predicted nucleotidyltransferase